MSGVGFVRFAKLTGAGIVLAAARHNKRAIRAESGGSVDPARSGLNSLLAGPDSPEGVAQLARSLMKAAGLGKLRKNAVRAIEFVFSLPIDTPIDLQAYFGECLRWAGDRFGGPGNILSADVHLDEGAPHCHVLTLPLIDGRMVGSDLVGGPKVLAAHLASFHETVASRYGLRKAPARLSARGRSAAAAAVLQRLRETNDPALRSAAWSVVRDAIERDPVPWASMMGVSLDVRGEKPMRSMTAIFTSPGKGPKKEASWSSPIGFAAATSDRTLCSVWFVPEKLSVDSEGSGPAELTSELVAKDVVARVDSTESTGDGS